MALLTGNASERLTLARSIDLLGGAAQRAARPGWAWLPGLFYPSVSWSLALASAAISWLGRRSGSFELGTEAGVPWHAIVWTGPIRLTDRIDAAGAVVVAVLAQLLACRLVAGLARLSSAERAGTSSPGLRALWDAGRGSGIPALGISLSLVLVYGIAILVVAAPLALLHEPIEGLAGPTALAVAVALAIAFLALYGALLQVLLQLALHSLVANRRGTGSALVHAWRLVRASPASAARAGAVDLFVTWLLVMALWVSWPLDAVTLGLVGVALRAYVGTLRAGFWSRAYRALGGLSADEGVPGLPARE